MAKAELLHTRDNLARFMTYSVVNACNIPQLNHKITTAVHIPWNISKVILHTTATLLLISYCGGGTRQKAGKVPKFPVSSVVIDL